MSHNLEWMAYQRLNYDVEVSDIRVENYLELPLIESSKNWTYGGSSWRPQSRVCERISKPQNPSNLEEIGFRKSTLALIIIIRARINIIYRKRKWY